MLGFFGVFLNYIYEFDSNAIYWNEKQTQTNNPYYRVHFRLDCMNKLSTHAS